MNVVGCKNDHFFDGDEHLKRPICGETAESAESSAARRASRKDILDETRFRISLPGYDAKESVYGCVLHHPQRCARTMWIGDNIPLDQIHIVHNGIVPARFQLRTETDVVAISLTNEKSEGNSESFEMVEHGKYKFRVPKRHYEIPIDAQWDTLSTYDVPISDVYESWEFIFSKDSICLDPYLGGYLQTGKDTFTSAKTEEEKECLMLDMIKKSFGDR